MVYLKYLKVPCFYLMMLTLYHGTTKVLFCKGKYHDIYQSTIVLHLRKGKKSTMVLAWYSGYVHLYVDMYLMVYLMKQHFTMVLPQKCL